MVKDATESYSHEETNAALEVNIRNYATAAVTPQESWMRSLASRCPTSVAIWHQARCAVTVYARVDTACAPSYVDSMFRELLKRALADASGRRLSSDDFNQRAFFASAGKLAVKDLFPRSEVDLAANDEGRQLAPDGFVFPVADFYLVVIPGNKRFGFSL